MYWKNSIQCIHVILKKKYSFCSWFYEGWCHTEIHLIHTASALFTAIFRVYKLKILSTA